LDEGGVRVEDVPPRDEALDADVLFLREESRRSLAAGAGEADEAREPESALADRLPSEAAGLRARS
jgi:hypothetical protein